MSMDWDEYAIYDPGVSAPLNMLPRAEARAAFDRLMAARPARVEMLRRLLKANGLDLGTTDPAIQDLDPLVQQFSRGPAPSCVHNRTSKRM